MHARLRRGSTACIMLCSGDGKANRPQPSRSAIRKFGELAYRPGAGRGGDVMSQHGKTRHPISWRRGGESAGLATARLHPGRDNY
jgi:hypothetical protein